MATHDIIITDGEGTKRLNNGNYSVSVVANGYKDSSIKPTAVTVKADVAVYDFTVSSSGTLILHVTETGTRSGVPVAGATFVRCDKNGTAYGNAVTTDASGDATFNALPYSTTNVTYVYYKQIASDDEHDFDDTLKQIALTQASTTLQVENTPFTTRTIRLTDENYENLPVESATVSFTTA